MLFFIRYRMYIVYGLLALVVLAPLLVPGYILTLDMVFVPHAPLPQEITNNFVFQAALHYAGYIIPGDILQKIILLAFIFFAAVGMHRLVEYISEAQKKLPAASVRSWQWAAYIAGIFYVINPFVYGRFMAGQYLVLLGYMFLPFFVRSILRFLDAPTFSKAVSPTVYMLTISIVSIHTIGLAALLAAVAAIVTARQGRRNRQYLFDIIKYGTASVAAWLVLSACWLVPLVQGHGQTAAEINSFDVSDASGFATDGGLLYVLMLRGFWVEAQGLFAQVDSILPLSGLLQLAVWALIVSGIVVAWRRARKICIILGTAACVAVIFAVCRPLTDWLASHLFVFAGYREPHKFVAVLALAYSVFLAFGAAAVLQGLTHYKHSLAYGVAAAVLVVLPLLNTPTMVWGFNGQLAARQYPTDWHTANKYLNNDTGNFKVLFLPWHLYMRFGFSDRIIANPAAKFFDKPIVSSDNLEFAGIPLHTRLPENMALESDILPEAANTATLGSRLAPLDIKYVVLAKDAANAQNYLYLNAQNDVYAVLDTPTITVYRNAASGVD